MILKINTPKEARKNDLNYGIGSIFLAGPTPRDTETKSWRPEFIKKLSKRDVKCTVLIPEAEDNIWKNTYLSQCEWEYRHLHNATAIAFWVPRELNKMPAFTTNVEFGYWVCNKKTFYGRPKDTPKTGYLDWLYKKELLREPAWCMEDLIDQTIKYCRGKK